MKKEIMTPDHPRWKEFYERLEGEEGCNFRYTNGKGKVKDITWDCGGGRDKSFAISILETMEGIDVEKSLDFFDKHGGHCDCEIIFNVEGFSRLFGSKIVDVVNKEIDKKIPIRKELSDE